MSASGKDQPPLAEAQGVLFMTVPLPTALTHLPDQPRGIVCGACPPPPHAPPHRQESECPWGLRQGQPGPVPHGQPLGEAGKSLGGRAADPPLHVLAWRPSASQLVSLCLNSFKKYEGTSSSCLPGTRVIRWVNTSSTTGDSEHSLSHIVPASSLTEWLTLEICSFLRFRFPTS